MPALYIALAGLLGLLVGSFLNVVIYRLPIMMDREWRRQCQSLESEAPSPPAKAPGREADVAPFNLVQPRSACPACKTPIKARHNVPLLGYLWLRGRCAKCGEQISVRYPIVEAFTGVVSALIAARFGSGPECLGALILTWSLIALAGIDLDHQLLPDAITLPLLWAGLLFHVVIAPGGEHAVFAVLRDGVIGAIAGYLSLWIIYHGFRLATGKEGMGYGDFKLFAALGAWLGWQMLPLVILLSALTGAITGIALMAFRGLGRQTPIPFGPYLAAAGFVGLLWGKDIMAAYWHTALP